MRIGHGYDVHKLVEGRPLWLGNTYSTRERAFGSFGCGRFVARDYGQPAGSRGAGGYRAAFSRSGSRLSRRRQQKIVGDSARKNKKSRIPYFKFGCNHSGAGPRLAGYLPQMQEGIAHLLEISPNQVNIKATTEEGLGFTGQKEGMAAHCVCLLEEMPPSDDEKTKK